MTALGGISLRSNVSLAERAWNIRRKALLMGEVQGQGYIGQALGIADVLATSYFHALEYRAEDPEWEGARPLLPVHRSLRHRALRRADGGRHPARGRACNLWHG